MWRRFHKIRHHKLDDITELDDFTAMVTPEMGVSVVIEASAVVHGTMAGFYAVGGRPVPGWAWLNAVAHRLPSQLADLVAAAGGDRPAGSWAEVSMKIAADLSRVDETEAAAIQAALLIPAELAVLAGTALPGGPTQLLRAVQRRLSTDGARPPRGEPR